MEHYVGQITIFAGNYAPAGWALCQGQLLPISENEALYSLLGTTFGGDGRTTFGLPDLRGRIPVGMGANPATGTNYSIGQMAGVEEVTLTEAQLPAHTHALMVNKTEGGEMSPGSAVPGVSSSDDTFLAYAPPTTDPAKMKPLNAQTVSTEGGGQSHNNVMPSQPLNFIIALTGVYPSQN